jgi:hypothetical protein
MTHWQEDLGQRPPLSGQRGRKESHGQLSPQRPGVLGYHVDTSEPCTASLPSRQSGVLIHIIAALGRDRDMTASHCLPLRTSRKESVLSAGVHELL